jgi:hypothetical protein
MVLPWTIGRGLSIHAVMVDRSRAVRRFVFRIRTMSPQPLPVGVIRAMGGEVEDGPKQPGEQEHEQQERSLCFADLAKGTAAAHGHADNSAGRANPRR